jgi:hypothetical protein
MIYIFAVLIGLVVCIAFYELCEYLYNRYFRR